MAEASGLTVADVTRRYNAAKQTTTQGLETPQQMAQRVGVTLPANWDVPGGPYDEPFEKIDYYNRLNITPDELRRAGVPQADIDVMLRSGLNSEPSTVYPSVVVYGPDGTPYGSALAAMRAGVFNYSSTPPTSGTGGTTGGTTDTTARSSSFVPLSNFTSSALMTGQQDGGLSRMRALSAADSASVPANIGVLPGATTSTAGPGTTTAAAGSIPATTVTTSAAEDIQAKLRKKYLPETWGEPGGAYDTPEEQIQYLNKEKRRPVELTHAGVSDADIGKLLAGGWKGSQFDQEMQDRLSLSWDDRWRNVLSLPEDKRAAQIQYFNEQGMSPFALRQAGLSQADIDKLSQMGYLGEGVANAGFGFAKAVEPLAQSLAKKYTTPPQTIQDPNDPSQVRVFLPQELVEEVRSLNLRPDQAAALLTRAFNTTPGGISQKAYMEALNRADDVSEFKNYMYADGADANTAFQRGLEYMQRNKWSPEQSQAMWSQALGQIIPVERLMQIQQDAEPEQFNRILKMQGFAKGGLVGKPRRFQVGGLNEVDQRADMAELSERYGVPLPDMPEAPMGAALATAPAMPMGAPAQPMDLNAMLARYMQPGASSYGAELAAARKKSEAETAAFQKMLQDAIQGSGEGGGPSKAEMYFRLAAAFAEPGKTGSFGEGLGRAAGAMAEQQKTEREARRAAAREKLQLGLTAQQARMTGAREDVSSLRQLAGEEMKDKRTITAELLKEWAKRNDPVSTAGKQAQDEGLVPGTPEFQKRVREISELAVERANMQITAAVAGMNTQAANLALAQAREARVAKKEEDASKKLTPQELKLKTETEDLIASADSALGSLRQAYKLNPNTFDASLPDMAQRKILEAAGSKDPKLINTRTMENLLGEQALSKLKSTFGAAPTEGERKILMDLQGIGAKSREERAAIMRTAFQLLQTARDRQQRRLNEITQGLYRDVGTPAAGGLE